ncbi:hypothetical protein GGQ72_004566 [Rhizobium rhizoryzae]|uniref:Uncharacterized protein n=1 Tax=Rhizobium rhizoryzae TaxID=451876 RepID=A0A7W6LKF5_9HYPH|nr:hypothetical protein [Rhizobium rhizoryzae]
MSHKMKSKFASVAFATFAIGIFAPALASSGDGGCLGSRRFNNSSSRSPDP